MIEVHSDKTRKKFLEEWTHEKFSKYNKERWITYIWNECFRFHEVNHFCFYDHNYFKTLPEK